MLTKITLPVKVILHKFLKMLRWDMLVVH